MDAVQVEGVSKRYRLGEGRPGRSLRDAIRSSVAVLMSLGGRRRPREEIWALRDVDLRVAEGQALGVIGRNGAGKSTLLKILSRITEPTAGVSRTRGRVATLLEVGTGFHPELTGRENIYLNGAILGMTRRDITGRFDEIVEFAGFRQFLDTPIKRYSSGMHLRLAFSVAAHLEPDILVVDEILAVGDAEFQRKCLRRMADVEREGRTVVFVSHDLESIARLCSSAIWLEDGYVAARGPTDEVIDAYVAKALDRGRNVRVTAQGGPFSLRSVEASGGSGAGSDVLRRDQPFSIVVRYSLLEDTPGFDMALYVVNDSGTRVFDEAWSDSHDARPTSAGGYELRLTVPPVLVPGEYRIGVWAGTPHETFLHERVAGAFRLAGSLRGRPERTVELLLPWEVTLVQHGEATGDAWT